MRTKKILALLMALALCLTLLPTAALAEDSGTYTVEVEANYDLSGARSMLDMVNDLRTGDDAWQLDEDEQRVELPGLGELQYSYALEEIAMQRAIEVALSFSHTRPNGESCFSCLASDGTRTWGENIAAGYRTAQAAFEGWCETDEPYAGQGHRRNMLKDGFQSIGIAHVVYAGTHYWVQEFSWDALSDADSAVDGAQTRSVDVAASSVTGYGTAQTEPASLSLTVGETAAAPQAGASLTIDGAWGGQAPTAWVTPAWQSADAGVATVADGVVTAVGAGETTLTATAFGQSLTATVTVSGQQTEPLTDGHYLIGPDWTVSAIDPARKFMDNPNAQGEKLLTTTLREGEKIKVVKVVNGQINAWWPDGVDNEYTVDAAHAGEVTIYFRDAYHPDWASFGGYIYIGAPVQIDYAEVYGASLSLKGNIGLNFYVFFPDSLLADPDAYVTLDGEQIPIAGATTQDIDGRTAYRFSASVHAKEMGRALTLKVFDGQGTPVTLMYHGEDVTEKGHVYAVRDYLDSVMATCDSLYLLDLARAMNDYGSCAQAVFQYRLDDRAPLVCDVDSVKAADLAAFAVEKTVKEDAGLSYVGSSLRLHSETCIRHYFHVEQGKIADYRICVDGVQVTPKKSGSRWYVEIPNISAKDLDQSYLITVSDSQGQIFSLRYSALSYAWKILDMGSDDADLLRQVKSLYLYWHAAEAYFSNR